MPGAGGPVLGPVLGIENADVESSSDDYARRFAGPVGRHFLAVQERLTLALLAPWPGARVLDVGGGHAQLAVPLAGRGYAVTVAGSSEVCRARLDRLLPAGSFAFQAADLLALPFPDRSFDVVLCYRLLSHAHEPRRLLAELCRVARAAVLVDYPDVRSFNALYRALFPVKRAAEGNTRTFRCYGVDEVPAELARLGFGDAVRRRQFFVPMVVHRLLRQRWLTRTLEGASAALGLTAAFGSPVILRAVRRETASGEGRGA